MPDARCLNCHAAMSALDRFCPQCGQRSDTSRLVTGDVVRELMHSFVSIERGPLALLRALLTRPGHLARDHVEGQRRRHYGPFATLAVLVGVITLAVNASGYQILAQDGLASAPADLLQRHFNLLLLAQLPLLGAICALVFRSDRLTLAEHMVLVAYALCMRAAVLLLVVPLSWLSANPAPTANQTMAFWAAWYVYFAWAASQFYRGPRAAQFAKGLLAAALGHGAIMLFIRLGSALHTLAGPLWPRS